MIFISYAHADETPVLNLYQELSSRGYNLWLDKRDILPGDIHTIPLRLEKVDYPPRLEGYQGIDWFKPDDRDKLFNSLDKALAQYQ